MYLKVLLLKYLANCHGTCASRGKSEDDADDFLDLLFSVVGSCEYAFTQTVNVFGRSVSKATW